MLIAFILGVSLIISIESIKHIKEERNRIKIENIELMEKIAEVETVNSEIQSEVNFFKSKSDSLDVELEKAKIRKTKLSNEVKSSKVRNDTILIYLPLYQEKENQTDSLIRNFEKLADLKDSIIFRQDCIIMNDSLSISALKLNVSEITEHNQKLQRQVIREKRKKYIWEAISGVEAITILALII